MVSKKILHVSSVDPVPNSGMGRVSFYWKKAFEDKGYEFIHIGLDKIDASTHPLLRALKFRKYILNNNVQADLVLAHEPLAGFLKFKKTPLISFSHGIEERGWIKLNEYFPNETKLASKLIPRQFRFYSNNKGFKEADLIFLLNKEDQSFLINEKDINDKKIALINNGHFVVTDRSSTFVNEEETIGFLFNASWLKRKGIHLLVEVFNDLFDKYPFIKLNIAGANQSSEAILQNFKNEFHDRITVWKPFDMKGESLIYANANVFLLPSYYEGQSLALLQAMANGLCPIVSDNCGQMDIVKHKKNGLVFTTGDKNVFKEQIEFCINNPSSFQILGNNAKSLIKNNTWANVANEVVAYCEKLLI